MLLQSEVATGVTTATDRPHMRKTLVLEAERVALLTRCTEN